MSKIDRSRDPLHNPGGNPPDPSAPPLIVRHVNASQLASLLGYHRNTIMGWPAKGCPVVQQADVSTGTPWIFDVSAVVKWLMDEAVKAAIAKYESVDGNENEAQSKARKIKHSANITQIEAAKLMRTVVTTEYVYAEMTRDYGEVKSIVSKIPDVIAANVESSIAAHVHKIADEQCREVMARLQVIMVDEIEE